jgi:hypothetical protein
VCGLIHPAILPAIASLKKSKHFANNLDLRLRWISSMISMKNLASSVCAYDQCGYDRDGNPRTQRYKSHYKWKSCWRRCDHMTVRSGRI